MSGEKGETIFKLLRNKSYANEGYIFNFLKVLESLDWNDVGSGGVPSRNLFYKM